MLGLLVVTIQRAMVCWNRPANAEGKRKTATRVVPATGGAAGEAEPAAEGVPPAEELLEGDRAPDGTPLKNGVPCCDACDGAHLTTACPVYKGKSRDKHKDAQKGKGPSIGGDGGSFTLRTARVVRQPGDGSCLFHSMAYGIGGTNASSLRREIADWIGANPRLEIAETPVSNWVQWDSSVSVATYARRMRVGGWGGGIEMAACSNIKGVNIHVYEAKRMGSAFKRISCFDSPGARRTVHVLYQGGVHYDALIP